MEQNNELMQTQQEEGKIEILQVSNVESLGALNRSEIDAQIATAN